MHSFKINGSRFEKVSKIKYFSGFLPNIRTSINQQLTLPKMMTYYLSKLTVTNDFEVNFFSFFLSRLEWVRAEKVHWIIALIRHINHLQITGFEVVCRKIKITMMRFINIGLNHQICLKMPAGIDL